MAYKLKPDMMVAMLPVLQGEGCEREGDGHGRVN